MAYFTSHLTGDWHCHWCGLLHADEYPDALVKVRKLSPQVGHRGEVAASGRQAAHLEGSYCLVSFTVAVVKYDGRNVREKGCVAHSSSLQTIMAGKSQAAEA